MCVCVFCSDMFLYLRFFFYFCNQLLTFYVNIFHVEFYCRCPCRKEEGRPSQKRGLAIILFHDNCVGVKGVIFLMLPLGQKQRHLEKKIREP